MRPRAAAAITIALALTGCQPLPEVGYETDRLQLATDFDAPVCAATLARLDEAADRIAASLASPATRDDPYRVYWLQNTLSDQCAEDTSGCFYPGTRVVFAQAPSLAHEMVHATIDSPGQAFFIEEGLAELYSGRGVRHDPRTLSGRLDSLLRLSRDAYGHGGLSYPQASHFAYWLEDAKGPAAIEQLGAALSNGTGDAGLARQLDELFGTSIHAIEQRYAAEAPHTYPGAYDDSVPYRELGDHALWAGVDLRCDDPDVYGPLPDGSPGMFRTFELRVGESRSLRLRLEGDQHTWVELLDPRRLDRQRPPWAPGIGGPSRVIRLQPGDQSTQFFEAGRYLVVLGTSDTSPRRVDLQILR